MSEELFDVVFFGILQTGKDKETVLQNMAKLFKTQPQKLIPYFAGGRKVIKGRVNADTAEKYKAALENVGLVIKLEAAEDTAKTTATAPPAQSSEATASARVLVEQANNIDISNITVAEVGADVLEHPVAVVTQPIDDISDISMAEAGVDVLEHPVEVAAQDIGDISDLTMAEPGTDVLDHPKPVVAQKIEDISNITLAEAGADIIENPKPEKVPPPPDTSELSLD